MPVRRAFHAQPRRLWPPLASLLALLAVAASPAPASAGEIAPAPAPGAVLTELVQDVGGRGAAQTPQRYAYLKKLDSHLQDVAASRLGTGSQSDARAAAARQGVTTAAQGDVSVDVYVNGGVAQAAAALRALGMRVVAVGDREPQRMVEGFLPAAALPAAAVLPATRAIIAPYSSLSTGAFLSQGDAAIHGPQARALGPQGAGVSVGVISDSIDRVGSGITDSQGTGDLPAGVQNLGDPPSGGTDEGRAMAEIVYDEAPAISSIVFKTAYGGPAAKASSIDELVSHGVKVIADDTSYVTEPFFQDGVISQAVDRAKAAGVAYFISAGNDGSQSWEGTYSGGATQDFDPGPAVDTVQTVGTVDAGNPILLVLQWAQPWNAATTDFAVDVYSISGGVPTYAFTQNSDNLASHIPEEVIPISASSGTVTFGIAIRRVAGSGNPLLKYIDFTNGAGTVGIEHPTGSGAIGPDAASARGALTVAASPYTTPTTPEPFSSRGPVVRRFDANGNALAVPDVRQKPDLAAPDGVTTSLPDFAPFYGTSAAAPAAAGIAALLLSAKPSMSVDELYAIMTNPVNALDCPAPGNPDVDCGAGFLLADRALPMALDSTAPVITPVISPAAPDGPAGWYRVPVTVTWSVSDPDSPVVNPVGCSAAAPGDGDGQITCSATSAGGTASVGVTVKRDSTPPSAPLIGGIAPKTYLSTTLPATASIGCVASDPTSGITGCAVTGYSSVAGAHMLTATATNGAGLVATSTLGYTVAKPAAIAQLRLAKGITLGKLAKSGLPVTLRVATASTKLVVKLVARVPKAPGKGTPVIVLGTLERRVPAGTARLRITLTAKAKRQLRGLAKATLKVTITATSANAQTKLLTGSAVARR